MQLCYIILTNMCNIKHRKPFFFPNVLKRWYFQKNCPGIWSFMYYRERWYFFFPKIWSYTLNRKWKVSFFKNTRKYDFLQAFWKDGLSKKGRAGTWPFLYYLERWHFFSKTNFFLGQKVKWGLSQEIHGRMIHCPPAKKDRKPNV